MKDLHNNDDFSGDRLATNTEQSPTEFVEHWDDSGSDLVTPMVPSRRALALVERYEARIDTLLASQAEALGQAERARADAAEALDQLHISELHTAHELEKARISLERAEESAKHSHVVAELARVRQEQAEERLAVTQRRLDALQRSDSLPWWAWRRRRTLAAVAGLIHTD